MDGETDVVSGCSQRENKRSYRGFLMDVEDLEEAGSDAEDHNSERPHKEPNGSLNELHGQHIGCSGTDPEPQEAELCGLLPAYTVCVSQDRCSMRGEEENIQENMLRPYCPAEGNVGQRGLSAMMEHWLYLDNQHNMADGHVNRPVSPSVPPVGSMVSLLTDTCNPNGSMRSATTSAWDTLRSTTRSLCCSDQDPVSVAAHLHLLGESLSLIGRHLQGTNKMVCMSSSFSLLLDSLLCALAPLICLTTQIPELRSCTPHTLASTLENIAYVMPGL